LQEVTTLEGSNHVARCHLQGQVKGIKHKPEGIAKDNVSTAKAVRVWGSAYVSSKEKTSRPSVEAAAHIRPVAEKLTDLQRI
jgi:hypothetical protein